jgi:hypothetical protein
LFIHRHVYAALVDRLEQVHATEIRCCQKLICRQPHSNIGCLSTTR